jgi:hypothetical protein
MLTWVRLIEDKDEGQSQQSISVYSDALCVLRVELRGGGSPIGRAYFAQRHKVLHLAERHRFIVV